MSENFEGGATDGSALRSLWEHHWWSFEQFLDEVSALDEADFRRDLNISYGSVHGIAAHLVGAEIVWLRRVRDGESVARVPGTEELPDLASIENAWEESRAGWQRVFAEDDLRRVIHYRNTKGQEFSDPLWRVMAHLVDHGATYRGLLIAALRLLGRKPPATGLITYARIVSGKFSL